MCWFHNSYSALYTYNRNPVSAQNTVVRRSLHPFNSSDIIGFIVENICFSSTLLPIFPVRWDGMVIFHLMSCSMYRNCMVVSLTILFVYAFITIQHLKCSLFRQCFRNTHSLQRNECYRGTNSLLIIFSYSFNYQNLS